MQEPVTYIVELCWKQVCPQEDCHYTYFYSQVVMLALLCSGLNGLGI